jgi:hypothetical protein
MAALPALLAVALVGACAAATPDVDPALPALVDLFKSTGGQEWANSSNWLSPMDVCTWCDAPHIFPPFCAQCPTHQNVSLSGSSPCCLQALHSADPHCPALCKLLHCAC